MSLKKNRHKKTKLLKKLSRGGIDDFVPAAVSDLDDLFDDFDDAGEFDHLNLKAGDPCPCCGKPLYEQVMSYEELIEFERRSEQKQSVE